MMLIPPMECPTSTTGPAGVVASSTSPRSRPVRSMVARVSLVQPERPCPRWSQRTSRARSRTAARWRSHSTRRAVKPCEKTTVSGASAGPSTSTCRGTPSSVVTVREPGGGGPVGRGSDGNGASVDTPPIPGPGGPACNWGSGAAPAPGRLLPDQPARGVDLTGDGGEHAVGQELRVVRVVVRADIGLEAADAPPQGRDLGEVRCLLAGPARDHGLGDGVGG